MLFEVGKVKEVGVRIVGEIAEGAITEFGVSMQPKDYELKRTIFRSHAGACIRRLFQKIGN